MLCENQRFIARWNCKNINHYKSKGYVFTKYGDEFEVKLDDLSPNSNMKIHVSCDYCGEEMIIPYFHYYRSISKHPKIACQKCAGIKLSEVTLQKRQEKMYNDILKFCEEHNYSLLTKKEDLKNNLSEVTYCCPLHGITNTKVTSCRQGKICYKCSRIKASKNKNATTLKDRQESLYSRLLDITKEKGYILLTSIDSISKNSDYIEYKCPIHGVHSMRIYNMLNGKGCPECRVEHLRSTFQLSPDEVKERVKSCDMEILNPDEYVNQGTKNLRVICPECGEEFLSSLSVITNRNGQVCPSCSHNESKGERAIRHYLESNNIGFIQEKWFRDCRDRKPLRFDFYIPDYNMCIEFDGDQHFYDKGDFSTSLEYTQKHDEIKNKYCTDNNIKLLRIPYWKYSKIETILNKELNLHKDIV